MSKFIVTLLILCLSYLPSFAVIHWVPDEFSSIQLALNNSIENDTVLIRQGSYTEQLSFPGHNIMMGSEFVLNADTLAVQNTIIRPLGQGGRIIFAPVIAVPCDLRIIGISFTRPQNANYCGGMQINNRHFQFENCRYDSVFTAEGGVLMVNGGTVRIAQSRFNNHKSNGRGDLFFFRDTEVRLETSVFNECPINDGNSHDYIVLENSSLFLRSNLFENIGTHHWDGPNFIDIDSSSNNVQINNCVFSNNRFRTIFDRVERLVPQIVFDSNYVFQNQFSDYCFSTNDFASTQHLIVNRNVFEENYETPTQHVPLIQIGSLSQTRTEISRNTFIRNHCNEISCIQMIGPQTWVEISNNYFIENHNQADHYPPGGAVLLLNTTNTTSYHHNIFWDNMGLAVFSGLGNRSASYAQNCFWGDMTGPYNSIENPIGQGDTVDTMIVYTPWQTDTSFLQSVDEPTISPTIPTDFLIGFAYPNPFNSEVTIEYVVTGTHFIKLEIFDLLGRKVETLVNELQSVGIHQAHWQGTTFSSGIYFARLSAEDSPQPPWLKKLILLK